MKSVTKRSTLPKNGMCRTGRAISNALALTGGPVIVRHENGRLYLLHAEFAGVFPLEALTPDGAPTGMRDRCSWHKLTLETDFLEK